MMNKDLLKKIIKEELLQEAQWGNFTGGAAPLDTPIRDSGPIPKEQLKKLWDMYIEMGKSPEDILATPEFREAGINDPEQLTEWGGGPSGTATGTANFEWSPDGLAMIMYLDGKKVMDFQTQKEVKKLISQLQGLLDGPMRTSP